MPEIIIRQIEMPRPGVQPRELRLSGSCGPLNEITRSVEQRAQVDWIPGARVASVRLDGPEEGEHEIEFEWMGRLIVAGEASTGQAGQALAMVLDVDGLERTIADFVRDTALVQVQWGRRTDVGMLRSWESREGMLAEYGGTLKFQPLESPGNIRAYQAPAPTPRNLYETVRAEFETAIAPAERIVTLARTQVDNAAQAVADVRGGLARMRSVVDSAALVQSEAVGVRRATGETMTELGQTNTAALTVLSAPAAELAQSDDPLAQMRARRWRDTNAGAHRGMRRSLILARRDYRPEGDVLGVHEAVEGQTIWGVAWVWYRDAAFIDAGAHAIRRRNRLTSTTLRAGQRLVIPKRGA